MGADHQSLILHTEAFRELTSSGRLPAEQTDVSAYEVDGRVFLAEVFQRLRKHYIRTNCSETDTSTTSNTAAEPFKKHASSTDSNFPPHTSEQRVPLQSNLKPPHTFVFIGRVPLQQHAPLPQAVLQLLPVPGAAGPALQREAGQRREGGQSTQQRRQPGRAGGRGQRSQAEFHFLQRAQAPRCEESGPPFIPH